MHIIFDTRNIYYLPQYLPIYRELVGRGHKCDFVCYRNKDDESQSLQIFSNLNLSAHWFDNRQHAMEYYLAEKANWVFFGSGVNFIDQLHRVSRSAQLGHGIGPKPSYYHKSDTPMTVRFIEGELRLKVIKSMYPDDNFVQVGYSKLDPLLQGIEPGLEYAELGLDDNKSTILYAPTFNPSSLECFPNNWPKDFGQYNILIKPHAFSYSRAQYHGQRRKLKNWARFQNVYVADASEVSLLPFMKHADILLSEASSTLFEFAALDRPVIVCDFYKLKWFYRGPFRYRFDRRFRQDNVVYADIGRHISCYRELAQAIESELDEPKRHQVSRAQYTRDHVGVMDGLASKRIVDYLEQYTEAGLTSR